MAIKRRTPEDLEILRQQQIKGIAPKMKANLNKDYEIYVHDQDHLHVKLTERRDNGNLYEDISTIKMFSPEFYGQNQGFITAGFNKAEIIHDPRLM